MPFLIIFVVIPLIELMVFAHVSKFIGISTALFLAFLTAVIGGLVVRHQGLKTIIAMKETLDHGKLPLSELFDGFCLVAAGATLITPGFLTDTIGFLLLIPAVRGFLRHIIKTHTNWHVSAQNYEEQRRCKNPDIIEGEYERLDGEGD